MTNKEKFLLLVSDEPTNTAKNIKWLIENREQLRKCRKVTLAVLHFMSDFKLSIQEVASMSNFDFIRLEKMLHGKEIFNDRELLRLTMLIDITPAAY